MISPSPRIKTPSSPINNLKKSCKNSKHGRITINPLWHCCNIQNWRDTDLSCLHLVTKIMCRVNPGRGSGITPSETSVIGGLAAAWTCWKNKASPQPRCYRQAVPHDKNIRAGRFKLYVFQQGQYNWQLWGWRMVTSFYKGPFSCYFNKRTKNTIH